MTAKPLRGDDGDGVSALFQYKFPIQFSTANDDPNVEPSLRGAKRRSNPFFLYAARWIASLRSQ
jgi:hypothetical protein